MKSYWHQWMFGILAVVLGLAAVFAAQDTIHWVTRNWLFALSQARGATEVSGK